MASLDHLLPAADEILSCTEFSAAVGANPAGTGITADRVVLVETPRPWPKPVFDHPDLREVKKAISVNPAVRLWAVVPDDSRRRSGIGSGSGDTAVIVFDRLADGRVRHHRYLVDRGDRLVELADALAHNRVEGCEPLVITDEILTTPVVLVCTQGSHDVCCGSKGTRLAAEIAQRFPEVVVHRVSHTGGHRFAPTAMTFPDGRMWASMDLPLVARLLDGGFDQARCRGWWGAEFGPAQVAEAAVRALNDADFDFRPRSVQTTPSADGDITRCLVTTPTATWTVTVSLARLVPTISCRAPGGLPHKVAADYRVDSVVAAD